VVPKKQNFVQFVAERDAAGTCNFLKKIFRNWYSTVESVFSESMKVRHAFSPKKGPDAQFVLGYYNTVLYPYDQVRMACFPGCLWLLGDAFDRLNDLHTHHKWMI
jgi:hypothetical protein